MTLYIKRGTDKKHELFNYLKPKYVDGNLNVFYDVKDEFRLIVTLTTIEGRTPAFFVCVFHNDDSDAVVWSGPVDFIFSVSD